MVLIDVLILLAIIVLIVHLVDKFASVENRPPSRMLVGIVVAVLVLVLMLMILNGMTLPRIQITR